MKISAAAIAVILSVTTSLITTSYSVGNASARLDAVEGAARESKRDFEELEKRADADHDLIIQIAADFRYIRERLTQEKSQ